MSAILQSRRLAVGCLNDAVGFLRIFRVLTIPQKRNKPRQGRPHHLGPVDATSDESGGDTGYSRCGRAAQFAAYENKWS